MGGDAQLDQSTFGRLSSRSVATPSFPSKPSRPENMGLRGVCSMSQFPGLLMTLEDEDRGGVEGYPSGSPISVSRMIVGLWFRGLGEAIGVMVEGALVLLYIFDCASGCVDELGLEYTGVEVRVGTAGYRCISWKPGCEVNCMC